MSLVQTPAAAGAVPSPPRVQEPAMFDRGKRGRFLRTLFPLNLTAEPGVGSCAQPWATPYRGKNFSGALRRDMRALSFPTVDHVDK